jgi:ABC-type phosphate transport system substrate-binding protein
MDVKLRFRMAHEGRYRVTIFVNEKELPETESYLTGSLDETKSFLYQWEKGFRALEDVSLRLNQIPVSEPVSPDEVAMSYKSLKLNFNQWLRERDPQWQSAREKLARRLGHAHTSEDEIYILIDVEEGYLRRFPWRDWEFFQNNCPKAEIALCQLTNTAQNLPPSDSVKVLVVVGKTQNIEVIKELQQEKKGVFTVLKQPSSDKLLDELHNHIYEIFIFTGHSGSDNNGDIGWIDLSDTDPLQLAHLTFALSEAINKRLQLCIFNSCDGLGLAKQLAELKLPLAIVMREPVPDLVAAKFLRVFLQNFSGGHSFFKSFRKARQQLESFNGKYPGVCGLPTVCINSSFKPPTWKELGGSGSNSTASSSESNSVASLIDGSKLIPPPPLSSWKRLLLPGLVVALLSLAVLGYIWWKYKDSNTIGLIIPTPNVIKTKIKDVQPPQSSGEIRYGGSSSAQKLANTIETKINTAFPNIKFTPSFSGTETSLQKINDKQIDFMFASEGVNTMTPTTQKVIIAHDAIAVVVNPKLPVKSLTMDDLRNIITGNVTDWKNIPNANLTSSIPIHVYYRHEGTTEFLKDTLPKNLGDKNKAFKGKNFFELTDPKSRLTEAKNKVQNDPGGVYFVTASQAVAPCEFKPIPIIDDHKTMAIAPYQDQLIPGYNSGICASKQKQKPDKVNTQAIKNGTYPLIRPIYLVLRTDDQKAREWGEYYLKVLKTDEGKKLILETGLVPK